MKKLRVWQIPLLALAFLLSLPRSPLFAQTYKPVFAKQYSRAGGRSEVASDSFKACDPSGTFKMVVINGPPGQKPVSGDYIRLNGVEVVDLKHRLQKIEVPLTNVTTDNVVEVLLRGTPGGTIQVSLEGIQQCLRITITSSTAGTEINRSPVSVRGNIKAPEGTEVGVTVNGFPGLVANGQFTAIVPVDSTVTSLTATVTDAAGSTATDTIPVTVLPSPAESPVLLSASPPGGLAPLTVGFQLSSLVGVSQISLDLGNGTVPFQGTSLEGQTFTYSQPGIYSPTVQVTDPQGQVHSAVTLIEVYDRASLDARLQAIWQGLKDALRSGDVTQAATFIHGDTRARYQAQFSRFSPATLANIDQYMTSIQLVEVGFAGAQYEMLRGQNGQTRSFAVWFQMDQDGLWRVRRF